MEVLLQLLIGGILQGGIYALGAFGLSLIFGVLRVLNVAHGASLILGAYAPFLLSSGPLALRGPRPDLPGLRPDRNGGRARHDPPHPGPDRPRVPRGLHPHHARDLDRKSTRLHSGHGSLL